MSSPGSAPSSPASQLSSPARGRMAAMSPPDPQLDGAGADGDLASMGSGSLDDGQDGASVGNLGNGQEIDGQHLHEACMSESTALAVAVTGNVDCLLAQRSDQDCAAKELDVGLEDEPLSAVRPLPSQSVCYLLCQSCFARALCCERAVVLTSLELCR